VISYWVNSDHVNPGAWITIFLSVIVALNCINHRLPSRIEFCMASFKLVVMLALMILSTIIALGGGPDHDLRGFRYWSYPGAFGAHHHGGLVDKFYITCSTMSNATFAYIGSERSGMCYFPNVRKATSRAIRNTFYRILVFHLLAISLLGMIVPQNSVTVVFYSRASDHAAASAFVAALNLAGIAVLPDLLNACILCFVLSIADYDLYLATKAMCDLSLKRRAPAFLSRTRRGVPIYALGVCSSLATLAYLNVNQDSTIVFGYFVDMVTMLGLLTWISILVTHISFVRARKAQGIPDKALEFRARFGLPGTYLALVLCIFISVTIIFDSFSFDETGARKFNVSSFIASYISIPIYIILMIGHKFIVRSKHVSPKEADLWSGKTEPSQPNAERHMELVDVSH
jgi:amino acid transporter